MHIKINVKEKKKKCFPIKMMDLRVKITVKGNWIALQNSG